jgi:DNA-directed RNA polymerase specialized sigma24 family protein
VAGTFMTAEGLSKKIMPEHREEIENCFKSKSGAVYGFLFRFTRGDRELSEDVLQETFRKAAQNWHKLHDRTEQEREAWLIEVAFNTAADVFRRAETAREKQPQIRERYWPAETDVYRQAMTSIAIQRFIELIAAMPPARSRVAFLSWRCGWGSRLLPGPLLLRPRPPTEGPQAGPGAFAWSPSPGRPRPAGARPGRRGIERGPTTLLVRRLRWFLVR